MRQDRHASRTYFQYATYFLALAVSALVVYAPFPRGMFFREDYLRFLPWVAWTCVAVAAVSLFNRERIWHVDFDAALFLVTLLYWLTTTWAVSKGPALDGAIKYTSYLAVFLVARYLGKVPWASRILRNGFVISGLVATLVGLLSAAKIILYPSAVVSGRIYGSFQYPNALAAYAMFTFFFCLFAWSEAENSSRWWLRWFLSFLYSLAAFCLLTVVILSYSRATWLIFGLCLLAYFLLLPRDIRLKTFWRFVSTTISVLAINRQLADALLKDSYLVTRKYLLMGASIAGVLEVVCLVVSELMVPLLVKRRPWECGSAEQTVAAEHVIDARIIIRRRILTSILGALVVLLLVIGAFTTYFGRSFMEKIIPQSIVKRFGSISLMDRSLVVRFHATKDAFLIAMDHPFGAGAGGWNALYHMYQKTLYWFTETHNHFAQVLVETGFPGLLLYVLFWGGLIYVFLKVFMRYKHYSGLSVSSALSRKTSEADAKDLSLRFSSVVSSGIAILSLGLHSSADFDLSLPSISIALFAAIGVFLSQSESLVDLGSLTGPLKGLWLSWSQNRQKGAPKGQHVRSKEVKRKASSAYSLAGQVLDVLVTLVVAVFIIKPSHSLFHGIVLGSQGVYSIYNGDISGGRNYLLEAIHYDPYQSSYPMDLARTYLQEYQNYQDEGSKGMAKLYLDLAKKTDPFNLQDRVDQTGILYALGFYDDSVTSAEEVLRLCPLDKSMYDLFSTCARKAMWQHLEAWEAAVKENNQAKAEKEKGYITQLITYVSQIPTTLSEKKEAVKGTYAAVWNANELNPTPGTLLVMGQAAYLQGNDAKALEYLSQAAKDKNLANEANTWLYSLSIATRARVALPGGFKPDQKSVQVIVQAHGWAK